MLKYLKQLGGDSLIYGLSTVLTRFIGLLLIPMYTRVFQPADYGVINLIAVTFVLIEIFVVFGLDNSVAVWFWDTDDTGDRKKTFSSWIWFQFSLALFIGVIIVLSSSFMSKLILSSTSYYYIFIIMGCNLPLATSHRFLQNWYKLQRKALPTVAFTVSITLITILLTIFFVVYLRIGVKGVFISQLISSAIGFFVVLIVMKGWYSISTFKRDRLKPMLKFAIPLIPASISYWILGGAGSYFVEKFASKTEVGLYQIGISFGSIVGVVVTAFQTAFPAFALSISKSENHKEVYAAVFLLYIGLGSIAASFIWMFSSELLMLFTQPSYYSAENVVGILAFNVFVSGIPSIINIGPNIAKNNKPYGYAIVLSAAICILLYTVLIPWLGKEGAAFTTLCSNIFVVIYLGIMAERIYPIPYDWKITLLSSIGSLLLLGFSKYYFNDSFFSKILFFLLIMTAIIIMIIPKLKSMLSKF